MVVIKTLSAKRDSKDLNLGERSLSRIKKKTKKGGKLIDELGHLIFLNVLLFLVKKRIHLKLFLCDSRF